MAILQLKHQNMYSNKYTILLTTVEQRGYNRKVV